MISVGSEVRPFYPMRAQQRSKRRARRPTTSIPHGITKWACRYPILAAGPRPARNLPGGRGSSLLEHGQLRAQVEKLFEVTA